MVTVHELFLLMLATNQAVEIWRHSLIMAPLRLRVDIDVPPPLVPERIHANARRLLRCPFCLSLWVAGFIFVSWYLGKELIAESQDSWRGVAAQFFGWPPIIMIVALGISRGANLINDLTWKFNRTPKVHASSDSSE